MINELKKTFAKVFKIDEALINEQTTIQNLEAWDSMRHLELITTIESDFNIKFKMKEIIALDSVAKILQTIESKKQNT